MAYLVILAGVASSGSQKKETVQATVQVNSIKCLALPAAVL